MLTFSEPDIPQSLPVVAEWLLQHRPDCFLPLNRLRKLAEMPGSGLRCVRVPSCGTRRTHLLYLRPADVIKYVEAMTIS